ncbi:hypothetical protein ACX0G9_24610 [Flavitalea flava]
MQSGKILFRIRCLLVFFMVVLALSGITAFPVYTELKWLLDSGITPSATPIGDWLEKVWLGVKDAQERHPFIFYGFDWLAFAHLVIALLFVGPYRDPVYRDIGLLEKITLCRNTANNGLRLVDLWSTKNKWVIEWAMLACIAILPLAMIAGPIRSIPWIHIFIDCSFGIIGIIPLGIIRHWILQLEARNQLGTKNLLESQLEIKSQPIP